MGMGICKTGLIEEPGLSQSQAPTLAAPSPARWITAEAGCLSKCWVTMENPDRRTEFDFGVHIQYGRLNVCDTVLRVV